MLIIVPMAGSGQRFVDAGYKTAKPFIEIVDVTGARPVMDRVFAMFQDPADEFIFICNRYHVHQVTEYVNGLGHPAKLVWTDPHKFGPVWSVTMAFEHIADDEEVIVSYCDGTLPIDRVAFKAHVDDNALDGCLFTHTDFHPHMLASTKMAFLKEQDGAVVEVKEKSSYTDKPASEHASSGVYWFRRGAHVKHYFKQMIDNKLDFKGEYYVTLVYNLMIRDRLKVGYFDTDHVAILGTPEEVRNFEAWAVILRGHQVKTEEDALRCYRYWKAYHHV